ncbi:MULTISPECIES: DUF4407 domain-containing protein [unclassified Tenacibaculum]|uniref:DUF4407 domain-containing protein n=1 Tax=unclassified Tenacibaculum TaxID=2635139 RepID=UPI001F422AE9|nr:MULTISPECIES: DUF4407 domain-containing protein [unclassified Tenacibaculum]MCF2875075.1 DUF4407 domain-containing protein [Tenacibaculum sp. Cn5-1]MCF2935151.1 DUF4407 domain-containing protein [Tenacibaculum sp. Cn5-34]MCG7511407.1 DUF4407 domain-containing protein [Tenacibaculum sp. Cn5-46]
MSCSEASKKSVKKYTAALLIIMIMWLLIGFLFSREYLRLPIIGCAISGVVLMIIIVQIERQIILGSKNRNTTAFRITLGLVMALLGSVIVDQIIFKEDIIKEKMMNVNEEVSQILPQKINEINLQVNELDSLMQKKEKERDLLIIEVTKTPSIRLPKYETQRIPSKTSDGRDTILIQKKYITESVLNPKAKLIEDAGKQISKLRKERSQLSHQIIDAREKTEKELLHSKGFLDELKIMFRILLSSPVSMIVWGLWLLFFLIIELFVLISKLADSENDYERIIKHQMEVRIDAINKLTKLN